MDQEEINQAEWENPDNWSDSFVGFYFSKTDSRTWVPKRNPRMGCTMNLGKPAGAWWMFGLWIIPTTILAITVVVMAP